MGALSKPFRNDEARGPANSAGSHISVAPRTAPATWPIPTAGRLAQHAAALPHSGSHSYAACIGRQPSQVASCQLMSFSLHRLTCKAAGLEGEAARYELLDELPFDFVRRRLSVVLQVILPHGVRRLPGACGCARAARGGALLGMHHGQERRSERGPSLPRPALPAACLLACLLACLFGLKVCLTATELACSWRLPSKLRLDPQPDNFPVTLSCFHSRARRAARRCWCARGQWRRQWRSAAASRLGRRRCRWTTGGLPVHVPLVLPGPGWPLACWAAPCMYGLLAGPEGSPCAWGLHLGLPVL